jgi:UDP-N-acetyl-D-mannosaminuronate dehydrogenase
MMLNRLSTKCVTTLVRSRSLSGVAPVTEIKTVGVVGLGLMGHGIAQLAASNGYKVVGVESNQKALETGKERINKSVSMLLGKAVKKGTITEADAKAQQESIHKNLTFSVDQAALKDCDLIVEAIIEDLSIKVNKNTSSIYIHTACRGVLKILSQAKTICCFNLMFVLNMSYSSFSNVA